MILNPLAAIALRSNLLGALAEQAAQGRSAALRHTAGTFAQSGRDMADAAAQRTALVMEDAAQRRALGQRGLEAGLQSSGDLLRLLYGQKQATAENTLRRELAGNELAAAALRQSADIEGREKLLDKETAARAAAAEARQGFETKQTRDERVADVTRFFAQLAARRNEAREERDWEEGQTASKQAFAAAESAKDRALNERIHGAGATALPAADRDNLDFAADTMDRVKNTEDPEARSALYESYQRWLPDALKRTRDPETREILVSKIHSLRGYLTPSQQARLPVPTFNAQGELVPAEPEFAGLTPMDAGPRLFTLGEPQDPTAPAYSLERLPAEMLALLNTPPPTSQPARRPWRRLYGD